MSVGRLFLINELQRLEMHFYPDSSGDEEAIEYIRAAMRALTAQSVSDRARTKAAAPFTATQESLLKSPRI
jgi:hypothetical protein